MNITIAAPIRMSTRHEKNVQWKGRVKERKSHCQMSTAQPLRPISTCGLQLLQQALGLALVPCSPLRGQAHEGGFESESSDKAATSSSHSSRGYYIHTALPNCNKYQRVSLRKTIDISQDELVFILRRLLYLEDESTRQIRNLILVGHGFGFEMKAMKGGENTRPRT